MKHALRFVLFVAASLAASLPVSATLALRISDGTPAGTLVIVDQGLDDFNSVVGAVSYTGPVGANWLATVSTGTSKPILGSATSPRVDLNSFNVSSVAGGTITIELTDTGFLGSGPAAISIGGVTSGQVGFKLYTDNGNAAFGKSSLVAALGPFAGGVFSQNAPGLVTALPPYTITMEVVITHAVSSTTGLDAEVVVNPPPVCPPDRIVDCNESTDPTINLSLGTPSYTPQPDCGPVTITYSDLVLANIITRTWTIIDSCFHTNYCLQTITVSTNCNPPRTNCVVQAVAGGPCSDATTQHALWMPGIATDFIFSPNPGTLVENPDGTANISGTVVSASDPCKSFLVNLNLTGRTAVAPPGSPKKNLEDCAYSENGGPINTATWYYYTNFTGTLTGANCYDGALLTLTPTGPAFQVGFGANNKNLHFGASAWFIWQVVNQPTAGGALPVTGQGDFNLDIVDCVTIPQTNCVQKADGGGQCSDATTHHALWLPGIGTDFVFSPTPGSFVENPDGTAHLSGTVAKSSNPNQGFQVDVQLTGRTSVAPPGSPKKSLKDCAYAEDGGPVDTDTWHYYTNYTGTLTGTGEYLGAILTIVPTGPAFQVGLGANNKNLKYGASSWFIWTVVQHPIAGAPLTVTGQGDFNVDIGDCPAPGALGTASVSGKVKGDCDADGSLTGEAGLAGWTVTLKKGGSIIDVAVTDALGDYAFANLVAGSYVIHVTPQPGWKQTYDPDGNEDNKNSFSLSAGQIKTGKNFGYTGTNPDISLEVTGPPTAICGDTVTYTFAVTNTGNTCLYGGIKVKSPLLGGQIFHQTPVAPGQGFAFTKTYIITDKDPGLLVNNVTAIGDPPGSLANVTKLQSVATIITGLCPPAAPANLKEKAGNGFVKLSWDSVSGASSYTVKRSDTPGGPYAIIATGLTSKSYTDTGVVNGEAYYYVVVAVKGGISSADSAEVASVPSGGLPSPLHTKDIGAVGETGGAGEEGGIFTVSGSGKYIYGTADEFRFVYQSANGNCTVVARVVGLDNTHQWAKAGVMIRSSLNANSKFAAAYITPNDGVEFQTRTSTGGSSSQTIVPAIVPPQWVKVVRTGNTFRGYNSPDGVIWTEIGSQTISTGSSVQIGLAVTSHADGTLCTATFDNVTITP